MSIETPNSNSNSNSNNNHNQNEDKDKLTILETLSSHPPKPYTLCQRIGCDAKAVVGYSSIIDDKFYSETLLCHKHYYEFKAIYEDRGAV